MNRRRFLARSASAAIAAAAGPAVFAAAKKAGRPPRVLLRSSWQSVNIGDIGHTPGAISLLHKHFPEAEITLWPVNLGLGSRALLTKAYPQLKFVEGSLGPDNRPRSEALAKAWADTDLYLSGSGSGFPGSAQAVAFRRATGKAVGVFGVSTDPVSGFGAGRDPEGGTLAGLRARALKLPPTHLPTDLRFIMDQSAFFFCRDTISRDYLRAQGVKTPVLDFGPDAQLGMPLRDDAKGLAWLRERDLAAGKFICVIPRLRYTPYYKIRNTPRTKEDEARDAINDRTTEQDHAKLREMITAYVRATGNKVMVCAEMTYQVEMGREVLAIPGSIHSPQARGCHALIKQGAKLVESAKDVLEELGALSPRLPQESAVDDVAEEHPLLQHLGFDPVDTDTLQQRSGLAASAINSVLTELELTGLIESLPGGRWQRIS